MNKSLIRSIIWLSFFLLIILSWLYLFNMSATMGFDWTGKIVMDMSMNSMDMSYMVSLKMLFSMWSIMMLAMMLPTMVPTFLTYQDLIKSAHGTWGGWVGLLLGYIIMWTIFSLSIAYLQVFLMNTKFINNEGIIKSVWLVPALVILVGAFQFTKIKDFS